MAVERDTAWHGSGKIGNGSRVGAHIGALIVKEFVVDAEDTASASIAARTRWSWRE
jgi:hypothetical protein